MRLASCKTFSLRLPKTAQSLYLPLLQQRASAQRKRQSRDIMTHLLLPLLLWLLLLLAAAAAAPAAHNCCCPEYVRLSNERLRSGQAHRREVTLDEACSSRTHSGTVYRDQLIPSSGAATLRCAHCSPNDDSQLLHELLF